MIPIALLFMTGYVYHPDTLIICGKNPQTICLYLVEKCLQEGIKEGIDTGQNFEYCSEVIDPTYINEWNNN